MESSFTTNLLKDRAAQILDAIEAGNIDPGSDAISELAELTIALDDTPEVICGGAVKLEAVDQSTLPYCEPS